MSLFNKTPIPIVNKIIITFTSITSLILILFYSNIISFLTDYTTKYIKSYDRIIVESQVFILKITIIFFISLGFIISLILIFNLHKKFIKFLKSIIDTNKLKETFLKDDLLLNKYYNRNALIFSAIICILLHLKHLLFGDPDNENILEYLSSFLFFASSFILILSLLNLKKYSIPKKDKSIIKKWLFLCIITLLFVFFEEISWGQHIFKWESTGAFKDINFQSETNLHNFINPFFRFIYPLIGLGLFVILYLVYFFYKSKKPDWLLFITPHESLFLLTFFMAGASFNGQSETFEKMFSIFTLLYSVRILMCLHNPYYLKKQ